VNKDEKTDFQLATAKAQPQVPQDQAWNSQQAKQTLQVADDPLQLALGTDGSHGKYTSLGRVCPEKGCQLVAIRPHGGTCIGEEAVRDMI
jgi:hypothetical protein